MPHLLYPHAIVVVQELSARLAAEKISKQKETESKETLARQAKQQGMQIQNFEREKRALLDKLHEREKDAMRLRQTLQQAKQVGSNRLLERLNGLCDAAFSFSSSCCCFAGRICRTQICGSIRG
jgi:hypothetical protein